MNALRIEFNGTKDDFRRVFMDLWRMGAFKDTGAGYDRGLIRDWRGTEIMPQELGCHPRKTRIDATGDEMTTLKILIEYWIDMGYGFSTVTL